MSFKLYRLKDALAGAGNLDDGPTTAPNKVSFEDHARNIEAAAKHVDDCQDALEDAKYRLAEARRRAADFVNEHGLGITVSIEEA